MSAGKGSDRIQIKGKFASVVIQGEDGDDLIETNGILSQSTVLLGGDGNDTLRAGDGFHILVGAEGDDVIVPGNGESVISKGSGADIIEAGGGTRWVLEDIVRTEIPEIERESRISPLLLWIALAASVLALFVLLLFSKRRGRRT